MISGSRITVLLNAYLSAAYRGHEAFDHAAGVAAVRAKQPTGREAQRLAEILSGEELRRSGSVVLRFVAAEAPGARWQVECEVHGTCVGHATQRLAIDWMREPGGWCEECRGSLSDIAAGLDFSDPEDRADMRLAVESHYRNAKVEVLRRALADRGGKPDKRMDRWSLIRAIAETYIRQQPG